MGAVSSFHPFAAATTTKLGPENEPQGLGLREHGSFLGRNVVSHSPVHKRMHDEG